MSKPITVKLPERNLEFTTEVTDSDGFFFLSLVFNAQERQMVEEGRVQDAALALKERYDRRLNAAKDSNERKEIEETVNAEIANYIYHQIDTKRDIRSAVASRLIECFPELPPNLVFHDGANRFGIRLDITEIMAFFVQIVGVALAGIKVQDDEVVELKPAQSLPKQKFLPPIKGQSKQETEIAELRSRLAELESSRS